MARVRYLLSCDAFIQTSLKLYLINSILILQPQLQITTSTKRPMFGGNIILHVRSNFVLEDFHCVVTTSKGKLLTTRLISMGNTKLKTFAEIVTFSMSPEATFLVWHVDNWGRTVSASVTGI